MLFKPDANQTRATATGGPGRRDTSRALSEVASSRALGGAWNHGPVGGGGTPAGSHQEALEHAIGRTFHPDAARTIGNKTSNVARVGKDRKASIDSALTGRGFGKMQGKNNETVYHHADGHIVSVTNQGKAGLLVNSISTKK